MTSLRTLLCAAVATLALSLPAASQDESGPGIYPRDAYARAAGGVGKSGAIFLMIHNTTDTDDTLIDVRADVAARVQLHTHKDDGNGVMQMLHVPEGFPIPAGEMHELARGGDHVMLMGLTRAFQDGDTFPLTLVFEKAGEIVVEVTVDNDRKPGMGGMMDHGGDDGGQGMTHGAASGG